MSGQASAAAEELVDSTVRTHVAVSYLVNGDPRTVIPVEIDMEGESAIHRRTIIVDAILKMDMSLIGRQSRVRLQGNGRYLFGLGDPRLAATILENGDAVHEVDGRDRDGVCGLTSALATRWTPIERHRRQIMFMHGGRDWRGGLCRRRQSQ